VETDRENRQFLIVQSLVGVSGSKVMLPSANWIPSKTSPAIGTTVVENALRMVRLPFDCQIAWCFVALFNVIVFVVDNPLIGTNVISSVYVPDAISKVTGALNPFFHAANTAAWIVVKFRDPEPAGSIVYFPDI